MKKLLIICLLLLSSITYSQSVSLYEQFTWNGTTWIKQKEIIPADTQIYLHSNNIDIVTNGTARTFYLGNKLPTEYNKSNDNKTVRFETWKHEGINSEDGITLGTILDTKMGQLSIWVDNTMHTFTFTHSAIFK